MAELSGPQKAVLAAQVATRMARKSRLLAGVTAGARTAASSFARVLHLLWLEIMGVLFLFVALGFGASAWQEYHVHGTARQERLWLAAGVSLLFAWYGVSSFWRARRKRAH